MPVKLNHYWTIIPGANEAYNKFIIKEFIPVVNRLGMHAVAGWSVLVGAYSEIIFESVCSDLDVLEKALRDPSYKDIQLKLLNHVKNYKTKVLVKARLDEDYAVDVREDTVKFNQMWDVDATQREAYNLFVTQEFFPVLEDLGISIAREWEVLIGDGPRNICEGRTKNVDSLIRNLQGELFRRSKLRLRAYIENYESRILSFHIQKVKGYKSASYHIVAD